jgi:hypothetical protein
MQLDKMQRRMAHLIFTPLNTQLPPIADEFIKSTPKLNAQSRLEIYRRSYWYRLIDAFYEDFPGLLTLMGETDYDHLVQAYLAAHPSRSFSLRNLAQFLEAWLNTNPTFLGADLDICLDMVRLEWAHIEAFDAEERAALTIDELATAGSDSQFDLQPHISLLALHYPVDDVRIDAQNVDSAREYKGDTIFLSVYRHNFSVYYLRLSKEEFALLTSLRDGATLEQAIEQTFLNSKLALERQTEILQESFSKWARLGWLCGRESV